MLDEYEFYQGAVIRQLIVESEYSLTFRPYLREGRINAFVVNSRVGVYIKYSAKRMSPWRFTFSIEQAADLLDLEVKFPTSFVVLICEADGLVTLDCVQLHEIVSFQDTENAWVRLERPPRAQYGVGGNKADLGNKLPRGLGPILEALKPRARERYGAG